MKINQIALVLEGGGFRAMYTSGVLDAFLKHRIKFEYCIGVSAGAAYGISYVTEQYERNRKVNLQYTADKRYMSIRNLLKTGNLFNWDFVYGKIPNELIPLDYEAFFNSSTIFKVGMTSVEEGNIEYVSATKLAKDELMQAVTASSSLPFVSRMAHFRNKTYLDGGLADSIPIMKALADGNQKAVVALTRNAGYRKKRMKYPRLIKWHFRKYPQLANAILSRADRYNQTLKQLEQLETEGRIFIIRPESTMDVSRIENKPDKLDRLYQTGFQETEKILPRLLEWIGSENTVLM